jgi:hypothetical protein
MEIRQNPLSKNSLVFLRRWRASSPRVGGIFFYRSVLSVEGVNLDGSGVETILPDLIS